MLLQERERPEATSPEHPDAFPFTEFPFAVAGDSTTRTKKRAFLYDICQGWSVSHAAQVAGVHRTTAYVWRDRDPEFARALLDAEEAGADWVEDKLLEKVVKGDTVATIVRLKMDRRFIENQVIVPDNGMRDLISELRALAARAQPAVSLPAAQAPALALVQSTAQDVTDGARAAHEDQAQDQAQGTPPPPGMA